MVQASIKALAAPLFVLLALIVAVGCTAAQPTPTPQPQRDTKKELAVAHLFAIGVGQIFIGVGKDIFKNDLGSDIKLDLRAYADGSQIMTAFRNDELDVATVGTVPAILSYIQKPNFKIVGGTGGGGTLLLARKVAGIKSLKDLKGRTVAVPAVGNLQDFQLRGLILPSAGLEASADPDPNKVRVVTSAPTEMAARFKEGSIDGAIVFEPWGSFILQDQAAGAETLSEVWKDYSKYPDAFLIASNSMITQHRELLKRFLRAWAEATQVAQTSPQEAKQVIHDQLKAMQGTELPMTVIETAYPRATPQYDISPQALIALLQAAQKVYPDRITRLPSREELFDLSILNEVLREKGLPAVSS